MKKIGLSVFGFFLLVGVLLPLGAQTAVDAYREGQQSFQRDDFWSSIDAYRRAISLNSKYLEARQGLAEAFFSLGEYDEAYKQVQEALKLGKLNTSVNLLYGRILLGQLKLEEGLAQFQDVLVREPKNQGALFGLAEYQVMKGRLEQATEQFESIRKDDPANLRVLLSLMYVSAARNDRRTFDKVFSEALKYFSSDPRVHFAAASYWYSLKEKTAARTELNNFLTLSNGKDLRGWLLQAQLLLDEGKPAQAQQTIDEKVLKGMARGAKEPRAWFLRGVAMGELNQFNEAVNAFRMALNFEPDNETYRLALENLLLRKAQAEDPARASQTQVHLERSKDLTSKNFQSMALDELRRALLLNPLSIPARLSRADIWKAQGFRTSALQELETVAKLQPTYKSLAFLDDLEILRSLYSDSLAAHWGLKLDDLEAMNSLGTSKVFRPYLVGVYFNPDDSIGTFYDAPRVFAETFCDELQSSRSFSVESTDDLQKATQVDSFNTAFQKARDLEQEFFITVAFRQGLRDFSGEIKLFLARTGRLVQTFTVYKKGTLPVSLGIRELAKACTEAFPLRASVIKRESDTALVNLGKRDGLQKDQKFQILRDGSAELTGDKSWFAFNEADVLGSWTVGTSDDWTSEGKLQKNGFFDTIAVGDEVILVRDPPKSQGYSLLPISAQLQRDILGLR